jgi:DNA-directed RNA polymerase specialized sigma24 family protein
MTDIGHVCDLLQRLNGLNGLREYLDSVVREELVLRVCQQVLGNEHDAEDAFQATFVILSRKAASVEKQESLGNWLYGVARRVPIRSCKSARRATAWPLPAGIPWTATGSPPRAMISDL